MNYFLDKVTVENKDVLYRLLQYSLFEESLNDGNEMNEDGLFEYPYFNEYFIDESRDAYFVRNKENHQLLGFVMINTYMQKYDEGHSIAEFMILPKYRRHHLGKRVAIDCFNMYKGNWEVSPSYQSKSAYLFWKNVIHDYTYQQYDFIDGLFLFKN